MFSMRRVGLPTGNLDAIPASEQWDLVAGNPPHFIDISAMKLAGNRTGEAASSYFRKIIMDQPRKRSERDRSGRALRHLCAQLRRLHIRHRHHPPR
jgi:hypothetical protein